MPSREGKEAMTGIQYVTDGKGRKVAVQIDLKRYGAVLEEFWDGLISESRRTERTRRVTGQCALARRPQSRISWPHPTARGMQKLKGYKEQWRVRVGEWRVV
jgi:hypothetical protein